MTGLLRSGGDKTISAREAEGQAINIYYTAA